MAIDARFRMRADGRCEGREAIRGASGRSEILATIQTLRTTGRSFHAVAGALNAQGSRLGGRRWHLYSIARITEREVIKACLAVAPLPPGPCRRAWAGSGAC